MKTGQTTARQGASVRQAPRRVRMPRWVWIALVVLLPPAVLQITDLVITQRRVGQLRYMVRRVQLAPPSSITGSGSAQTNRQVYVFTLSFLSSLSNTQIRRLLYIPWRRLFRVNARGLRYEELTPEQQQRARALVAVLLRRPLNSVKSEDVDLTFVVYPSERGWACRYDWRLRSDPRTASVDVVYIS